MLDQVLKIQAIIK